MKTLLGLLRLGAAAALVASPVAMAQTASDEELSARIEALYPVEVLKIARPPDLAPDLAHATVMNPAGNSNAALQVYEITVDATTGERAPNR